MNRYEFISELKARLQRLPYDEVKNAVEYYEEYFDDAGSENEQRVISELGSPASVASQIIADFAIKDIETSKPSAKKGLSTIWIVILAIFASPIALPIAFCLVAVVFAILITIFALIFSLGITGIALIVTGVVSIIASILIAIKSFASFIFFAGVGFLSVGIGIILSYATIILSKKSFGWLANKISNYLKRRVKR